MRYNSLYALATDVLPKVADTQAVAPMEKKSYWKEEFGQLWGAVDVRSLGEAKVSGSYASRQLGCLTFSRINFGNQIFYRGHKRRSQSEDPFYSLSFPEYGQAYGIVGESGSSLVPGNIYLVSNRKKAELRVDGFYGTFNVKIPASSLEDRIGCQPDILNREISNPELIYHLMIQNIGSLLSQKDISGTREIDFVNNQILDAVSFYLTAGATMSVENVAVEAHRARVLAYIDQNFGDETLTPQKIADHCQISKSYLYKIFADSTPVIEQLKNRRLKAARSQILMGLAGQTMTQVAYQCGFKSSSEFSRLYKLKYGVSPSSERASGIKRGQ